MTAIVNNNAEVIDLGVVAQTGGDWRLTVRLFVNDHTPVATDTLANYTASGNFTDTDLAWPGVVSSVGGQAQRTSSVIAFAADGAPAAETIYGYVIYLSQQAGDPALYAERFATPITIASEGDGLDLSIKALLQSK